MSEYATLTIRGKTIKLPLIVGTEGEVGIDIASLRGETGAVTIDPGYGNTGSCESEVSFVDGEKGYLRYRGYTIEELAEKSTFLEVAFLLLRGELPTEDELASFTRDILDNMTLHESLRQFFGAFPRDAHPMAVAGAVIGSLSTFYPESMDPRNLDEVKESTRRLIAKLPTIAAYSYKHSKGQAFMYPSSDLNYVGNFLHMMFATPYRAYEPDPVVERAMDLIFILHADHEQNCSTATVRMVGSSQANLFASISAGVHALWGPLHGGANQSVIEMLHQIQDEGLDAKQFLEDVKNKKAGIRLMGFGHRVYKNYDPRAKILKKSCAEVLDRLGVDSPLLEIAARLEEMALNDEYFVQRKLYPNVDFYSGIILQAIGIPLHMFTVIFAMGRMPGWLAQWREMNANPKNRINRPRQIYTGQGKRSYVPIGQRDTK